MGLTNGNRGSSGKDKIVVNLTEAGIIIRLVFVGIAIIVASLAFYSVFANLLHTESGWQTIEAKNAKTPAYEEFVFQYKIGGGAESASSDWSHLTKVYPQNLDRAYRAFSTQEFEGVGNLFTVNHHPNEAVTVEPELYQALKLYRDCGSRYMFYGPMFEQLRGLFGCETDWEAEFFDSMENDEALSFVLGVRDLVSDPGVIDLEFLDDNQVYLRVSDEYLSYAQEHEFETYLDFFFMRNALIMDYVSDSLVAEGYTSGVLTCTDGFSRALGEGSYTMKLFDRWDGKVYQAAVMEYAGPKSVVTLRSYPMGNSPYYYVKDNGEIRSPFVDVTNATFKTAWENLMVSSETMGCAEVLIRSWDCFVSDEPDTALLHRQGIDTLTFEEGALYSTAPDFRFSDFYSDGTRAYRLAS